MLTQRRSFSSKAWVLTFILSIIVIPKRPISFVAGGWVDPDTPESALKSVSLKDGLDSYVLVMSDEFNIENRTFADGEDPTWTAGDHSDDARTAVGKGALIFYNHSYVTTQEGKLNITTTSEATKWKGFNPYTKKYEIFQKEFRGGMVNSWNKFCFSGGIVEISVKLPGKYDTAGLWPAFWLMGNLGRATYEHSTNMMWPWSFNKCDRNLQPAQEASGCAITRHWDLHAHQGRGATEIDILEVMPGKAEMAEGDLGVGLPYMSTTLQISPGIRTNRPIPGKDQVGRGWNWYKGLKFGPRTKQNQYFYGTLLDKTQKDEPAGRSVRQVYQADALSALTPMREEFWEMYHTYRLEWMPGPEGYLVWYLDGEPLYEIPAKSLEDASGAQIPEEPSYLIINTAVSTTWGFPQSCPESCAFSTTWGFPQSCPEGCACSCFDCSEAECRCAMPVGMCEMLPASMLVDWVRVYQLQNDSRHFVGCNHPNYPSHKFIQAHKWRYTRDTENEPLQSVQTGYGSCKKDADCQPGGSCNMRKKACICQKGWVGPNCKQHDYHDDNVRGPIRIPILWLQLPSSLAVILSLLLIILTTGVLVVVSHRRVQVQQSSDRETAAGGGSNSGTSLYYQSNISQSQGGGIN